ncbi:hypothetical protein AGMMS50268_09520 [Spirochaetia bacterium]|nr:hypothetical protein AGMMS50268_09520 [Spirochaetia bacterium]
MASGPAESITIAGRRFACNSEDDVTIQLSGFTNEVKMHGDGSSHVAKSRKPGKIDGLNVYIDHERDDLEFLQTETDKHSYLDTSITLCDGRVYAGSLQMTGDGTAESTKEGYAPITMEGPSLEKQG